jgi:hypothetical protein
MKNYDLIYHTSNVDMFYPASGNIIVPALHFGEYGCSPSFALGIIVGTRFSFLTIEKNNQLDPNLDLARWSAGFYGHEALVPPSMYHKLDEKKVLGIFNTYQACNEEYKQAFNDYDFWLRYAYEEVGLL